MLSYNEREYSSINDLYGKIIKKITGLVPGSDYLTFECTDGSVYVMLHEQDCCESVSIEDVCGEVKDLLNEPITLAEDVSNYVQREKLDEYDESFTWTYYKLATRKGYVTRRWYECMTLQKRSKVDIWKKKEV